MKCMKTKRGRPRGSRSRSEPEEVDEPIPLKPLEAVPELNNFSKLGRVQIPSVQSTFAPKLSIHETPESWYFCTICGRAYGSKEPYLMHMAEHNETNDKNSQQLSQCPIVENQDMIENAESASKSGSDSDHIPSTSNSAESRARNIETKQNNKNRCPDCGQEISKLSHHYRTCHNETNPYKCTQCKCRFKTPRGLKNHFTMFHCIGRVRNVMANSKVKRAKILQRSKLLEPATFKKRVTKDSSTFSSKKARLPRMPLSDQTSSTSASLIPPNSDPQPSNPTKVSKMRMCRPKCTETTPLTTSAEMDKTLMCHCGLMFRSAPGLIYHMQTSHTDGEHKCSKCSCCYHTAVKLSRHIIRSHGSAVSKNICKVCGKFFHPAFLRLHMRVHTGEMPYKCAYCGLRFRYAQNLRTHLMTNHAFKNFKCQSCSCSFKSQGSLTAHINNIHSENGQQSNNSKYRLTGKIPPIKPLPQVAKKENPIYVKNKPEPFSSLMDPLPKTTKRKRDYKCKHCGKKFRTKTSAMDHLQNDHPRKEFVDSVLKTNFS